MSDGDFCACNAYIVFLTVASRNNDRTVSGKAYAWRLLGMMPAISRAATVAQPHEWRAERRTRLYHSCIDILVQQINDLTGRDIHLRYADKMVRRSRVFMDFLSMDGDEVSTATMCPTTQCTTCWCPRDQLQDTDQVFEFRDTQEICTELETERVQLLKEDGTPRDRCKERVSSVIYLYYTLHMFCIYHIYTIHIPKLSAPFSLR